MIKIVKGAGHDEARCMIKIVRGCMVILTTETTELSYKGYTEQEAIHISPSCIREQDFSAKQDFTVQSAWTKRFVPCTI